MRDNDTHVHRIVSTEPVKLEIVNFLSGAQTSRNYGFPVDIPVYTMFQTTFLNKSELEILFIFSNIRDRYK